MSLWGNIISFGQLLVKCYIGVGVELLLCHKKEHIETKFYAYAHYYVQSFPQSSAGKESACNAGDPGSIPVSGRSTGEGISYPLQSSWASLVAQLVKNLPAMWETRVWSLGWKDPLEKGKTTHSSSLAWRIPWTIQCRRVRHDWATFTFTFHV